MRRRLPFGFELLLRFLPREFRERHREELVEGIAAHTELEPRWRRAGSWIRAGIDVVVVGIGLRLRAVAGHGEGGWRVIGGIGQDVSFALRALRRRPGFSTIAALTLGLGIGASTAVYSVVNGVLIRPLPYADADRIGILWHELGDGAQRLPAVHALDVVDYRDRSRVFETFTMATGREWIVGGADDPELIDAGVVEAGFFEFFGAAPILGRTFTAADDVPGAAPVALLSHRLWARRFGSDPEVADDVLDVEGTPMQVVGVLPEWFRLHLPGEAFLLRDAELWTPMRLDAGRQPPRNFTGYTAFGRLRPGATFAQAQAELEVLEARLRAEHPEHAAANLQARVVPLHADVVKDAEDTLLVLLGAVGFVLLIACANVANLAIVRGHGRAQEYALRAALGAGRVGLVRLALVEAFLLAGAGAVVGGVLAVGALETLASFGRGSVPRLDAVAVDGAVLLFALAVTVLSGLLFGLVPALRTAVADPSGALAAERRSTGTREHRRLRNVLVVVEVASSFVLLVGAGLMVRTFTALSAVDSGFETDGVLTLRVNLPEAAFPEDEDADALVAELFDAVRAMPGVEGVTAVSQLPLTGAGPLQPFAYDEETASNWESVTADQRWVTPGFFEVSGARLLAGRAFTRDDARSGTSIVVDDRLAALAFPDGDAVGRLLQVNPNDAPEEIRYARIVGVVRHLSTSGDPAALASPVRTAVELLAPGAPVEDVRTMREIVDASLAPTRLALGLMSAFAIVALLLSGIGIYGVLSYAVAQRTREIGVRMALGQAPATVRRVIMAEGGRLVVVALVLGVGGAVGLSLVMSSLLYGVEPLDPLTYLWTALALGASAAAAVWIPARRATRVDPVSALRE